MQLRFEIFGQDTFELCADDMVGLGETMNFTTSVVLRDAEHHESRAAHA